MATSSTKTNNLPVLPASSSIVVGGKKPSFYLGPNMAQNYPRSSSPGPGESDSDSNSSVSSLITGLNLNQSGRRARYNPENTIPLSGPGRVHPFGNLSSSTRAGYLSRSSTSIKIYPPDDDDGDDGYGNRDAPEIIKPTKNKYHQSYKRSILSFQSRQKNMAKSKTTKSYSTLLAMGSSAIFSSESLLTTTTSAIPVYQFNHHEQKNSTFQDSIKSHGKFHFKQNGHPAGAISHQPEMMMGKPSIVGGDYSPQTPSSSALLSRHPLIDETRTRALSKAKLKQSSQVSALLSGFALVAMVEMDIQTPSTIPLSVLMFFIVTTTLLVSVHVMALMISTCILPHVESMNAMQEIAITLGTTQYGDNQSNFGSQSSPNQPNRLSPMASSGGGGGGGGVDPSLILNHKNEFTNQTADRMYRAESARIVEPSNYGTPPHQKMHWYISIAWFFSTVIGIFLFILELVAIVWVKFWDHNRNPDPEIENAKFMSDGTLIALIATLLLFPVLLALIYFAFHFYRKLVLLRYEMAQRVLDELNAMADGLSVCDQNVLGSMS